LEEIERDLANRQNLLEDAALKWFRAKRDREHAYATAYMKAEGTVDARRSQAALESCRVGAEDEALFEALKAVCRVLDTRATIGMALLKTQSR
jgi:hypothetical protein